MQYPILDDVEVYSVLVAIHPSNKDTNYVYPPIGSYDAALIKLFDPNNADDMLEIKDVYSDHIGGFDYTIKIKQGDIVTYATIPVAHDTSNPLDGSLFYTYAVNVPASDGPVTKVILYKTLDAQVNGYNNPKKRAEWKL